MNDWTLDGAPARSGAGFSVLARVAIAMLAVPATLTGCGDDPEPVTIELGDYTFRKVPDTIAVDTEIEVTNVSSTEAHELTAFRLPDDEHRPLSELTALAPEELGAVIAGAPVLAFAAMPGESGELMLGDGTLHEPGRYLLVCFIPTGASPDDVMAAFDAAAADPDAGPPMIEGGPPHFVHGMIAEVNVTA